MNHLHFSTFRLVPCRPLLLGVLTAICSVMPLARTLAQVPIVVEHHAPKRIVIVSGWTTASINPFFATGTVSQEIQGYIYESLLRTDETTLTYVPLLADSLPRYSMDHRTLEFKLNPAARFSDGRRVTPDDVIFSLKASMHPRVPFGRDMRPFLKDVERADRVEGDSLRVRIRLRVPSVPVESALAGVPIVPKYVWDPENISDDIKWEDLVTDSTRTFALDEMARLLDTEQDEDLVPLMVGSGPYMLEGIGGMGGDITLAKSRTYWNARSTYGTVFAERLVWRFEPDNERMIKLLLDGKADVIPFISIRAYMKAEAKLRRNGIAALLHRYPAYTYLGFNMARPIFRERSVRRAISHAVDRARIIRDVYGGHAEPVNGPVLRERPECDTTIPPMTFNLDSTRMLLNAAGWTDSDGDGVRDKMIDGRRTALSFRILINAGGETRLRMAEIIREALRGIGVRMELEALDWDDYLQRMRDHDFDAAISGWTASTSEVLMRQLWHSASISADGSNYGSFSNREVDSLIEASETEEFFSERVRMCRRIQRIIADEMPYCFLACPNGVALYRDVYENVTARLQRPPITPEYWWLKPKRGRK